MAAIPVPVHFDGHNINIITEDSPSTCKNRVKGINFGGKNKQNKKSKKRNNQNGKFVNGKAQILNKQRVNNGNNSNKSVISPISNNSSPSNKENIDELNNNDTNNITIDHGKNEQIIIKSTSPLPLAPKPAASNNNKQPIDTKPDNNNIDNKSTDSSVVPSIPIIPAPEINGNNNNGHTLIAPPPPIPSSQLLSPSITQPSMDDNAKCLTPSPAPNTVTASSADNPSSNASSNNGSPIKPIQLNAASMAKNPFTKRDNNNNNTPSLPLLSTSTNGGGGNINHNKSPGLPLPPRHQNQFKMTPRNVGNGALNKRKSPRLPAPFNPNQPQQTPQSQQLQIPQLQQQQLQQLQVPQPMDAISNISNTIQSSQEEGAGEYRILANTAAVSTNGHPPLHLLNPNVNNPSAAVLNPDDFGSHDDVGFDDDDSQNNGKDRQNLYKTELCREWSTSGWCYYNKRCSFAHGLQELRPVFRSKKWRTKRCRNWHTTGYCPYEHRCQFLHDQSPPRRISDYATANARALVAAQQRMQPLYFHYQVDCDRNETSGDDADDADNQSRKSKSSTKQRSIPNAPAPISNNHQLSELVPHTPAVGPRLKRKNYGKANKGMLSSPALGSESGSQGQPQFKRAALRMIQQKKHDNKKVIGLNKPMNNNNNKKNKKVKTPRSLNGDKDNSVGNVAKSKSKKKKSKDAVITPFNPVQASYGPTQSYELAAQQLGLYNPAAAQIMPARIPGQPAGVQAVAIPTIGALPPIPMSGINPTAIQGLPPSIDPTLYLSLTPSPPESPEHVPKQMTLPTTQQPQPPTTAQQQQQQLTAAALNVEIPVSLTPSPPTLPVTHPAVPPTHELQRQGLITQDPAQHAPHRNMQIALARHRQDLQALHAKVHELHAAQSDHTAEQHHVASMLHNNMHTKADTPVAPIDGAMLESFLPTDDIRDADGTSPKITEDLKNTALSLDDDTENNNNKKTPREKKPLNFGTAIGAEEDNKQQESDNNNNKKSTSAEPGNNNKKKNGSTTKKSKTLPPVPPIPPPLQLQTSINSVITGAVAAAMTPTAVTSLVPMTPTLVDPNGNAQLFGYPQTTTTTTTTAIPTTAVPTTTTTTTIPATAASVASSAAVTPATIGATAVPLLHATHPHGAVPTTAVPAFAAYAQPIDLSAAAQVAAAQASYAQQAHAHAHAYASAHAHAAHAAHHVTAHGVHAPHHPALNAYHVAAHPQFPHQQIAMQPQIGYPPFYAPSPDFHELQQTQYATNYAQYQTHPRHHY